MKIMDRGLARAIIALKTKAKLAERLGMSRQAVSLWRKIPLHRVLEVEAVTGVPKELLRPDVFSEAGE